MSISSTARAWNPNDFTTESPVRKAAKVLTLTAGNEKDAVFLAGLSACIRRGVPIQELVSLVEEKIQEDKMVADGQQAAEQGGQAWADWNARALDFGD